MKKYVKPSLEFIKLRAEERIATNNCVFVDFAYPIVQSCTPVPVQPTLDIANYCWDDTLCDS